ncbi:MAG: VOC family protein [Phenylobacterium sp.]|nr:VOC family protein [Phenylobacterium sp.]
MIRALMLALVVATSACGAGAIAAPAPERVSADQRVPLDLRRTTLVVRDIEASLAFYRAIGLVPIYDNVIRTPRDAKNDESAEQSLRLVFLRANDDYIGILGLMEYTRPERQPRPKRAPDDNLLNPGDIVLVFNVGNQEEVFARAVASPGVRVGETPHVVTYPGYDGTSVIRVSFSSVYDPDGHYVELNQVLTDLPVGE